MRKVLSVGLLALLSLSILAPALASVIVTTETTTVTGPCPLTATLQDGSPGGLTTTTTNICTNTFTYPSTTTTTTTTSTTMNPEVIYHVNGGPNCPTLGIAADVNSFRSNFTSANANGQDMWQINYYMSDLADHLLVVLSFTSINGTHTASQVVYQNGAIIQNTTVAGAFVTSIYPKETIITPLQPSQQIPNGDITKGQDIDFYTDGDGGQLFWYSAGQTEIIFGNNFPNFLQGPGVPFVSFNDMALQIAPIKATGVITFTNLDLNIQMGQQFEQPQPPANIPVTAVIDGNPCSLQQPVSPNMNANQVLLGPKNNDTLIELEMRSQ